MIVILDLPGGKTEALMRTFEQLGHDTRTTSALAEVERAARIVIPDGEAFPTLLRGLRDRLLVGPILHAAEQGRPLLGIGRGMHALFDVIHDGGQHTGLGLIPGKVVPLDLGRHPAALHFVIPHRGPNQVHWTTEGPLTTNLADGEYFFFDHACHAEPLDTAHLDATCNHGIDFCALAHQDRAFGVQFQPERSEAPGLRFLDNFAAL